MALVGAICNKLEDGFQDLRHAKARSMIDELARTETLARANLDEATAELSAMESGVGSDLSELRNLQSATSGTSDIRQKIV